MGKRGNPNRNLYRFGRGLGEFPVSINDRALLMQVQGAPPNVAQRLNNSEVDQGCSAQNGDDRALRPGTYPNANPKCRLDKDWRSKFDK